MLRREPTDAHNGNMRARVLQFVFRGRRVTPRWDFPVLIPVKEGETKTPLPLPHRRVRGAVREAAGALSPSPHRRPPPFSLAFTSEAKRLGFLSCERPFPPARRSAPQPAEQPMGGGRGAADQSAALPVEFFARPSSSGTLRLGHHLLLHIGGGASARLPCSFGCLGNRFAAYSPFCRRFCFCLSRLLEAG